MVDTPLDAFTFRRIGADELRRPAPRSRPSGNPVTGPSASVPGNPPTPAPKHR